MSSRAQQEQRLRGERGQRAAQVAARTRRLGILGGGAVAALIPALGCDSEKDRQPTASRAPVTVPAPRSMRGIPPPPGSSVLLRRTYGFGGRVRSVDSAVAVKPLTAPVRDPSSGASGGRRPLRFSVRIDDRGRDPLPVRWARFTLVSSAGARVSGYSQTPVRRLSPDRRGSPRATTLTFVVPAGFTPAQIRLSSIVGIWPFAARWQVTRRAAAGG